MNNGVITIYISARERKIVEILLARADEITVKDLASKIDVSPRTIHRDLKGVEDLLQKNGLRLMKKAGVGIKLIGHQEKIDDMHIFLFQVSDNEYTPDERQIIILCTLLPAPEPVKLLKLAKDLHVTMATISNDLTRLEQQLSTLGLTLVRRRGYGVEIIGTESSKRRAMSSILIQNLDELQFLRLLRNSVHHKSRYENLFHSDKILGLVEKEKLLIIEKELEEIHAELAYSIADSAYIGLVIQLALAIERIKRGEYIEIDSSYLNDLQDTKEYKHAQRIVEKLGRVFQLEISQGGNWLYMYAFTGGKTKN